MTCLRIHALILTALQLSASHSCAELSYSVSWSFELVFFLPFFHPDKKDKKISFKEKNNFFSLKVSNGSHLFGIISVCTSVMLVLLAWDKCLFSPAVHAYRKFCYREDPRGHMLIQTRLEIVHIFLGEWNKFLCLDRIDIRIPRRWDVGIATPARAWCSMVSCISEIWELISEYYQFSVLPLTKTTGGISALWELPPENRRRFLFWEAQLSCCVWEVSVALFHNNHAILHRQRIAISFSSCCQQISMGMVTR